MQTGFIIDHERAALVGEIHSNAWNALKTRNFYSTSVIWGVLGPKVLFSKDSPYSWIPYGFLVGAAVVFLVWLVQKWKPQWDLETYFNPTVFFAGAILFPVYTTTNLMTSAIVAIIL